MDPTTPLSIQLPRADWLLIEQLLAAHYSGHVAVVDSSRCMPILGVIGRARIIQEEEARAAVAVDPQTDARRESDRQRKRAHSAARRSTEVSSCTGTS